MNKEWAQQIESVIQTLNALTQQSVSIENNDSLQRLNESIQNFVEHSPYANQIPRKDPISQVYFDYALTGILETDENWQILRANQASASLSGYETTQLAHQNLSIIATLAEPERYEKHLSFLLEQGISQSSWHTERKDGSVIIVDVASIQIDEHRYIHVFDDVTDLRNAAESMQLAVIRAEEANRSKSQFLANISHELRTPLNGLIGLSQLLAGTSLDEKQREFVNKMHLSGVNLLHLVNDLLDVSKLETGKMQYEDAPFTLQQLQDDLVPTLALAKENPNLSMNVDISSMVPTSLQGDRYRIAQCLTNLIGNAIKFTQQGSVTLTINTETADQQSQWLVFKVSDTGIGIPEEVIPKLFQLFSQADASTTRRYGGTGLGLAITRQIARDLQGELTVDSQVGHGSCFILKLPLRLAKQAPAFEFEQDLDAPQEFAGCTILVAEDNEVNQIVITELLRLANIQSVMAENGLEVLERLKTLESPPDAILMDVQMPEMDGLAATKTLRKDGVTIPIIGLSAGASQKEQSMCFDSGMNDFLSKPIDADELWGCLTRWMKPKQTQPSVPKAAEPNIKESPIYQRALQAFIKQHRSDAGKLSQYIHDENREAIGKLAHSLKGASALMGFEQLAFIATELENSVKKAENLKSLRDFPPRLLRALNEAISVPDDI